MYIPKKTPDQLNCTTAIESYENFTKVIGQDNKESLIARPQFSSQYDNIDIYITLTPAKRIESNNIKLANLSDGKRV